MVLMWLRIIRNEGDCMCKVARGDQLCYGERIGETSKSESIIDTGNVQFFSFESSRQHVHMHGAEIE